jgi:DNA-binding transcriptional LysR family regulator
MDLKQLRTFRAVAELGSLSKAADRLRAAQPALSRHIKLLEHELRVELFVRNGRGMLLTSAGRMLLDRTTGLVRQIEQVRDDLQSASGKPSGRVGCRLRVADLPDGLNSLCSPGIISGHDCRCCA